jgi:hypothetical protein
MRPGRAVPLLLASSGPELHLYGYAVSRYGRTLAAGGRSNGGPGVRAHYHPDYYGAFVLDPDGHNIEVVCHEPG